MHLNTLNEHWMCFFLYLSIFLCFGEYNLESLLILFFDTGNTGMVFPKQGYDYKEMAKRGIEHGW